MSTPVNTIKKLIVEDSHDASPEELNSRIVFAINLFRELPKSEHARFLTALKKSMFIPHNYNVWLGWKFGHRNMNGKLFVNRNVVLIRDFFTEAQIAHAALYGSYKLKTNKNQ
jgi:hypothetical protein